MRGKIVRLVSVAAALGVLAVQDANAAGQNAEWKGAETFTQTSLAPNPTRCGASPPNVQATFAGSGVDTIGGLFLVTVSGCLNTETLHVFDLEATDTYVQTHDSVFIAPSDFTLVLDPETCVATNEMPASFRVAGGTGEYENARGEGHFDVALNWTPCNGLSHPTHLWFRGAIGG